MMSQKKDSVSLQGFILMILIPMLFGFLILTNQSLSFPLGNHDQQYLGSLLRGECPAVEDSWIFSLLDPIVVGLVPRGNAFVLLDVTRRWMSLLALLGLSVWVGRSSGRVQGLWVALLGVGLLPWRIAATTLHPHAGFLALFCWGCCLSFGKPWSKTGTAEQLGGGLFFGFSAFSAPLGYLYLLPLALRWPLDAKFRRSLEQPFGCGLLAGLAPGIGWALSLWGSPEKDFGLRPQTWTLAKAEQWVHHFPFIFGWVLLGLVAIGLLGCRRGISNHRREALDFLWPGLLALGLGETDTVAAALAVPPFLLLGVVGLETLGRIFVAKKEQVLLPTLLSLVLSYHLFFSGMAPIRERQAHAREVGSLANLVLNHVPDGSPVCLFRLNPVLNYLQALFPPREWREVDPKVFHSEEVGELAVKQVVLRWTNLYPKDREIWVDPKRMGEEPEAGGVGNPLKSLIFSSLINETYLGDHGAELSRFPIPTLKPEVRGKITTIRSPGESSE